MTKTIWQRASDAIRDLLHGPAPSKPKEPRPIPKQEAQVLFHDKFLEALKKEENGIRAGWNKGTKRWFPHRSVEGGTDTIAYGHKLSLGEFSSGMIEINGIKYGIGKDGLGLTEQQATALLMSDLTKAYEIAKREWDHFYGQPPFSVLRPKYQLVLTALAFNIGTLKSKKTGLWGWKNLANQILANNEQGVRAFMVTSYLTPKGNRVRLSGRAKALADAIGLAT